MRNAGFVLKINYLLHFKRSAYCVDVYRHSQAKKDGSSKCKHAILLSFFSHRIDQHTNNINNDSRIVYLSVGAGCNFIFSCAVVVPSVAVSSLQ